MKYTYLCGRLKQLGVDRSDLAYALDISPQAISHRFTGRTAWNVDEMYQVLDICRARPEELHIYFPRDGKAESSSAHSSALLGSIGGEIVLPSEIRIIADQRGTAKTAYRIRIDRI